ncbi:uncharacterized protein LOC110658749 isoform X2 [Hevea brasiliensis]|nr:uncharacterized protein LOC110658749 isoform X2 [Hevea brasiliensis]
MLKAVAIENPKDVNGAAEVIISEVLPFLSQQSMVDSPLHKDCSPSGLSGGRVVNDEQNNRTVTTSLESKSIAKEDACKTDLTSAIHHSGSTHQEKALNPPTLLSCGTNVDTNQFPGSSTNQLQRNIESEELILLLRSQHQDNVPSDLNIEREESILLMGSQHQEENVQSATSQTSKVTLSALSCDENMDFSQSCTESEVPASSLGKCQGINIKVGDEQTSQIMPINLSLENCGHDSRWKDHDGSSAGNFDRPHSEQVPQVVSCLGCSGLELENSMVEETLDAAEGDLQSELSATSSGSKILKSKQDIKIDFLEDVIEAAKNNKKTLFLAMESIMNMMRQVELQEKIAELAKEEAASAGLDILTKVKELKQMLEPAKEANDMHAGEIYGEKAILATEARELQARLISLSEERDKALAILDEMQQTLEARLDAAEELRRTAEEQKLEKEESARNALAEQEAIMEKVVQESKFLQQEAEENSKLREFLMDRGRFVDTLQGEISVICQDVRLLKERFDERVPLSKSITSSQTSCILASSASSVKSVASDELIPEQKEVSKSPKDRSPTSSICNHSPKSQQEDEENNRKELLDDGWDFFENDTDM